MSQKRRRRGVILTDKGYKKLQRAKSEAEKRSLPSRASLRYGWDG